MRYEGVGASVARRSRRLQSPSQFGGEFKRMFRYSPGTEVAHFRAP